MLAAFLLGQSYEDSNYSGYDDIDCTNYSVFSLFLDGKNQLLGCHLMTFAI